MKNQMQALMLSAALTGLMSGSVMAHASTPNMMKGNASVKAVKAGLSYSADDKDKHSCKGKNDCKGKGGCKSSDNGCKGKNSCKGKGGCATDGSKPKA
jgi:hypothetical protein